MISIVLLAIITDAKQKIKESTLLHDSKITYINIPKKNTKM